LPRASWVTRTYPMDIVLGTKMTKLAEKARR
jgi:hypothetical protein